MRSFLEMKCPPHPMASLGPGAGRHRRVYIHTSQKAHPPVRCLASHLSSQDHPNQPVRGTCALAPGTQGLYSQKTTVGDQVQGTLYWLVSLAPKQPFGTGPHCCQPQPRVGPAGELVLRALPHESKCSRERVSGGWERGWGSAGRGVGATGVSQRPRRSERLWQRKIDGRCLEAYSPLCPTACPPGPGVFSRATSLSSRATSPL